MPSITPSKLLPGVYITEIFPVTTSIANGPSFTEVLVGPIRTVVRGEQGVLGGPVFNTLEPCLDPGVSRWAFKIIIAALDTITVNFAGTVMSFTTDDVDVFVAQLRTRLLALNVGIEAIRDIYTATTSISGERFVKILASQGAIASGFFPSIQFTFGGTTTITTESGGALAPSNFLLFTPETETSHALPTLPPQWSSILNRRVIEEIIYGLDATRRGKPFTEPERFYYDVTTRMNDKLNEYLGLSANEKAFFGDFVFVDDASTIGLATPVVISKDPLGGTQRATAISIKTGIEFELRLGEDYAVTPVRTAGAYQFGDSLSWIPGGPTWAAFGTGPILVRASYVPDRYVMPLPVFNYHALTRRGKDVIEPTPINKFTFSPIGDSVLVDHIDPPAAARITYSGVYNVIKTAGKLSALVNFAPRLTKVVTVNATSAIDITISADGFCTPNIDPTSIVISRADGTLLVNLTDWTFSVATNAFTFYVAGPNQPTAVASNPLTIRYNYLPQVSFVGNPTINAVIPPTLVGYTPSFTHLGGGLFSASTPGVVEQARVVYPGTGYTSPPVVSFSGPGTLYGVDVGGGGTGYSNGDAVTFVGGSGSGALGFVETGSGNVIRVWMTSFGTGYLPADIVTAVFAGPGVGAIGTVIVDNSGGTGAAAVATVSGGSLSSIAITNHGTGYNHGVGVAISGGGGTGANAVASVGPAGLGGIDNVTVTAIGAYPFGDPPPLVTFTGTGTGARAFAFLNPGFIFNTLGEIFIMDPGSGYSPIPNTVSFFEASAGAPVPSSGTAEFFISAGGVVATAAVTATVEYPVQPDLRLEFMAERGDLDGDLYFLSQTSDIADTPQFSDTYAAQVVAADTSVANPTLHAAAISLTITQGVPLVVGVGDFSSPTRMDPVLDALKLQPNAYWLVGVTQDATAALLYLGGHVDTMVATIAGTQVHYAPGGFRVMETTLDQRNEIQFVPLAKDTTYGVGFLVNALSGGIAVQINLVGATGSVVDIQPGDFCEFYQTDPTGVALYGTTVFKKPVAKRLLITAVDTSILASSQFTVSDASLPVVLDPAGPGDTTFAFKYGAPVRFVRVRQDLDLGGDLGAFVAAIGSQPNGRRRWIRQPDIIVISDLDGISRVVPGYYLAVIEAAVRAGNLPHQGLTNFPLPIVSDVHRGANYYTTSDVINLMTDGGIQYATRRIAGGAVSFVQQLTSDRSNQLTQEPTVTQIVDFAARLVKQNLDPYIGVTNLTPSVTDAITTVIEGSIAQMKAIESNQLGPMIIDGNLVSLTRLPSTNVNAGLAIKIRLICAQPIGQINVTFLVDLPNAA